MQSDSSLSRRKLFGLIPLPFLAVASQAPPASRAAVSAPRFVQFSTSRIIDLTRIDAFRTYRSGVDGRKITVEVQINGENHCVCGDENEGYIVDLRNLILDHMQRQGVAEIGCLGGVDAMRTI